MSFVAIGPSANQVNKVVDATQAAQEAKADAVAKATAAVAKAGPILPPSPSATETVKVTSVDGKAPVVEVTAAQAQAMDAPADAGKPPWGWMAATAAVLWFFKR